MNKMVSIGIGLMIVGVSMLVLGIGVTNLGREGLKSTAAHRVGDGNYINPDQTSIDDHIAWGAYLMSLCLPLILCAMALCITGAILDRR